jgi:hypothetical protein
MVALFLLAFGTRPEQAGISIVSPTPGSTAIPTIPNAEPLVIGTAINPDPEARLRLHVTVLDESDELILATITVTWLENQFPNPLVFDEDLVEIPIPVGWTPVLVEVTKPGFRSVKRLITARLDEDGIYEWEVLLVTVEAAA